MLVQRCKDTGQRSRAGRNPRRAGMDAAESSYAGVGQTPADTGTYCWHI